MSVAFDNGLASLDSSSSFDSNSVNKISSNSAFESYRTIVPTDNSIWASELEKKFEELTSLSFGWDGYVGRPVQFACARFAADMLQRLFNSDVPAPSLVPGCDGTLQIEWHRNNYDVEIDVLGPNQVVASRFNLLANEDEIIELKSDVGPLVPWIGDLIVDRNLARQNEE